MINKVNVCPLGAQCERIVDGKIEVCMWQVELEGKNPQDNTDVKKKDCAMAVLPIMLVQSSAINSRLTSATESVRNVLHEGLKSVSDTSNKRLRHTGTE